MAMCRVKAKNLIQKKRNIPRRSGIIIMAICISRVKGKNLIQRNIPRRSVTPWVALTRWSWRWLSDATQILSYNEDQDDDDDDDPDGDDDDDDDDI